MNTISAKPSCAHPNKFELGKKGDLSTTQIVIIAVIVLILLFVFATKVGDFIFTESKRGPCQVSILKAHLLDEATAGVGETAAYMLNLRINTLKCNDLQDTIIKKSDVMKKGKINDDIVKKIIVKEMIDCNNMVGNGQIDPFKDYEGDQTYCLICSDLIFEDDFVKQIENEGKELKDFIYWLSSTTIPKSKDTYFERLYGIKPDPTTVKQYEGAGTAIDINQQYAIVWRMDKIDQSLVGALSRYSTGIMVGSYLGSFVPIPVVGTLGGAAFGMFGAYHLSEAAYGAETVTKGSGIFVVPKSQLGEDFTLGTVTKPFCTKLVNY